MLYHFNWNYLAYLKNCEISRDDVDQHLENVQGELESLRDLLKEEGYLDANALLGVCGTPLPGSSVQSLAVDTGMFFKASTLIYD